MTKTTQWGKNSKVAYETMGVTRCTNPSKNVIKCGVFHEEMTTFQFPAWPQCACSGEHATRRNFVVLRYTCFMMHMGIVVRTWKVTNVEKVRAAEHDAFVNNLPPLATTWRWWCLRLFIRPSAVANFCKQLLIGKGLWEHSWTEINVS